MWPNPQETAGLVTFTEEILDGKLHSLCSGTFLTFLFDDPFFITRTWNHKCTLVTNDMKHI